MSTMRNIMSSGLVALALSFAGPGLGVVDFNVAEAAPAYPDATANVAQRDNYFAPADISVPVGTTVRWTNGGYSEHTTTSDTGVWGSGTMNPGAQFSRTFSVPGTYLYHCVFHRSMGMVGRIVVTGGGIEPPPGPGPSPDGNLALGKSVRASSAQAGHPPADAVDGNLASYWASIAVDQVSSAAGRLNSQWIYVDLGTTYSVARLHTVWTVGQHARVYNVYVYCGGWCRIGATTSGDGDDTLSLSQPVRGQIFMLQLAYPAAPADHYELREWEIFGSTAMPSNIGNVALRRPARASSEQLGHQAALATDGSLATAWRSGPLPATLVVDFGRVVAVNRAILRWETGRHASRYMLLAYNGYSWYVVSNINYSAGGDDTVQFRTVASRYLLLYATGSSAPNVGLREFEVYGTGGTGGGGSPYPFSVEEPQWQANSDVAPPALVPEGIGTEGGALEGVVPEAQPADRDVEDH